MFRTLFHYPRVQFRHANGPLAEQRQTFLLALTSGGSPRSTVLRYARMLLAVATLLKFKGNRKVARSQIARSAKRWAQRQRKRGIAQGLKWSYEHFVQVACAWCAFMGLLKETPRPTPLWTKKVKAWGAFLCEEGRAEKTRCNYRWWASCFLGWLEEQNLPLSDIKLIAVDRFMKRLSAQGMSRVTLATAAKVLRCFLRYAYGQGWCRRNLASAVLTPRLFCQENLPSGPTWPQVRRLIAATEGATLPNLRNRAMLLLLAVYGLRCGEVRGLCLEDMDWKRGILRVRRAKTARAQEFPLTDATAQAIGLYLQVRPAAKCRELFVTLHAPFRSLSGGAVYHLTSSLLKELGIHSAKRGPHALRHACATHLLNTGFSLKAVGDHLGHRNLGTTQVYAKVDLTALRSVAAFDLGGRL